MLRIMETMLLVIDNL